MTNKTISITCDSDNVVALNAFSKALQEMAESNKIVTELNCKLNIDTTTLEEVSKMVHPEHNTVLMARSDAEIEQRIGEGWTVKTDESYVEVMKQIKTDHINTVTEPYVALDKDGLPWDARIHAASKALNADDTWRVRRKPKDMGDDEWAAEIESVRAELKQLMAIEAGATHVMSEYVLVGEPIPVEGGFSQGYIATVEPLPVVEDLSGEPSLEETLIATEHLTIVPPPVVTIEECAAAIASANQVFEAVEPPVVTPGDDHHVDAGTVTEETVAGIPPVAPPPVEAMTFPKLMTFLTERHGKITLVQVNELVAKHGLTNIQQFAQRPDLIGAFVADVKTLLGE